MINNLIYLICYSYYVITMNPFVSESMIKSYAVGGQEIHIQLEPGIFCPSTHGSKLADYINVKSGEHVLDMGTGTGLLGIVAAKQGGIVDVSDPFKKAVDLAIKNAQLNNVTVNGYVGEYFCTSRQTYDYIIANLPQEILPISYVKQIGDLETTISGGQKGNQHLLTFLEQAHIHMDNNSRALIAAYSVSDYITTLNKMKLLYAPKLLDVITSPAKDFVQENFQIYKPLIETGDVGLFKKDGLWQSTIFVYELKKKK